ncbi:hypothetical protein [Caulobacter sp.]|uniref:SctD/MshK family protein n=1 Tax=Caulobacter sp. TaxID=78 RepID=UPI00161C01C7
MLAQNATVERDDNPAEEPLADAGPILVLKVLAGRAQGAQASLDLGTAVTIGHDLDCDLVLRDPSAKGVKLRLTPASPSAEIEVLAGEIELLGHAVAAPGTAMLPAYLPLVIGDNALAVGTLDSPRWSEAERLLGARQRADNDDADQDEEPMPASMASSALEVLAGWRSILGRAGAMVRKTPHAASILLFGGALGCVTYAAANAPLWDARRPDTSRVHDMLSQNGFARLAVKDSPTEGKVVIGGVLPRESDKERLHQIVDNRRLPARIEVVTGEGLAKSVEDVFAASGLPAAARPEGLAGVRVEVAGSADRVAEIERTVRTDVRGLRALKIERRPGEDKAGKLFEDGPGKRVVSVVAGEAGFVTTADGARYFTGSVLPTGDRIVQVASQSVTVEKDGRTTQLMF